MKANLQIDEIHVGMMLMFPTNKMAGWVVDNSIVMFKPFKSELPCCKVQWANGSIGYEVVENIYNYRRRWLKLEKAHERLSKQD